MIARAFRGPHNLYRRYQALLESMIAAVGLAVIVAIALESLPVYPFNWVVAIAAAIAIVGVRWPLVAFIIAVGVMVYPIYTINLYLAVLFLAVSTLGHRLFVHYLGATVLVLATPVLAEYHLHWLVPILGGLWWGVAGAWIGGVAAIWGKLLGGMANLNLDWLVLAGQAPDIQAIAVRFHDANSLDTLLLIVEPLATTSNVILYNILQVVGWAVAAGFVGSLGGRKWIKYRAPWSTLVLTAGGGLIMLATHLGLPYWLQEAVSEEALVALQDPTELLFSLLVVIIVGTTVYSVRESLELPVAPPLNIRKTQLKKQGRARQSPLAGLFNRSSGANQGGGKSEAGGKISEELERPRRPLRVPHYSELPEWEPPQDEAGLIMLEID